MNDPASHPVSSSPDPASEPEPTPADVRLFTWALTLLGVLSLAIVAGSLAWKASRAEARRLPDRPRELIAFELTEASGRTVRRDELRHQVLVVSFVFTGCAQSCLEINRQLAEVQHRLPPGADIRLVSITVDPRSDTPEVLADFARRFGADPNRWLFLTGTREEVYRLIETSFLPRVPAIAATSSRGTATDPGPMPSDFEHAERIALVDRRGRVREFLDGLAPRVADRVLEAAGRLLAEPSP